MSLNPAWRPNFTEAELFEERTWLQGGILSAVAYGIVFTLFILNFSLLKDRTMAPGTLERKRLNVALLGYVCIMFLLSTLTMASQAQMTQLGFVDNRNYPGGPGAFQKEMFSLPISNLGNVHLTGIIYLYQVSRPGASPWATEMFTLIYSIISLGLNIVLTMMIVVRLFIHRRRVIKAIGSRHGAQYTGIISILVESAFILDIIVLLFIIPFALDSPLANTFLSTLVQVQTIASFMIIFRVATGTAWASSTANTLMTNDITDRVQELSVINFQRRGLDHTTAVDLRTSQEVTQHSEMGRKSMRGEPL
ncbi:hypothetical protein BJ165DRAFT_1541013 [Panaeolus papilionaceus]|nr:hypothetical protein BJ165DRAFT_1541013 [Panaeolus papilionaceus]